MTRFPCSLDRNRRMRVLTSDNFKADLTADATPPLSPLDLEFRGRRATYRANIPGISANGAKKAQSPRAAVRDATGIVRSHTSATWNMTKMSLGHAESRSHGKNLFLKTYGAEPSFGDPDRLSLYRVCVHTAGINSNGKPPTRAGGRGRFESNNAFDSSGCSPGGVSTA